MRERSQLSSLCHMPKSFSPARGLEPVHQHRAVTVRPQQTALQPRHVSVAGVCSRGGVHREPAIAGEGGEIPGCLRVSHSSVFSSVSHSKVFLSLHSPLHAQFVDLPWWSRPGDGCSLKTVLSLFSFPQGQPAPGAGHQGHRGTAALQRDHGQQHAQERQTQPRPEVRAQVPSPNPSEHGTAP